MTVEKTVHEVTYDLLRSLGLTTVFEFTSALVADGPTVIVVRTRPQLAHLG
jgi:hypothetical protein